MRWCCAISQLNSLQTSLAKKNNKEADKADLQMKQNGGKRTKRFKGRNETLQNTLLSIEAAVKKISSTIAFWKLSSKSQKYLMADSTFNIRTGFWSAILLKVDPVTFALLEIVHDFRNNLSIDYLHKSVLISKNSMSQEFST